MMACRLLSSRPRSVLWHVALACALLVVSPLSTVLFAQRAPMCGGVARVVEGASPDCHQVRLASEPAGLLSLATDQYSGLTVNPPVYLKASNTGIADFFGQAVAVSGDTLVVGAIGEAAIADPMDDGAILAGAVYVFVRDGETWVQEAYLKASNAQAGDLFGVSVAIDGDTIVVGATGEDSGATGADADGLDNSVADAGAAYVFVRDGSRWSEQAYLKAANPDVNDQFGFSVAVSGARILVGAPREDGGVAGVNGDDTDNSMWDAGAAFLFAYDGVTWAQESYLKASNPDALDEFGFSVALDGVRAVIGAPLEDSDAVGVDGDQGNCVPFCIGGLDSGAAYAFGFDGSNWVQEAYVKPSNTVQGIAFGRSVSIWGDSFIVGAPQEPTIATDSGAAYVFTKSEGVWAQAQYLKASNAGYLDRFGDAVSMDSGHAVVGASQESSNTTGVNGDEDDDSSIGAGAAYLFEKSVGGWTQSAYLKASNTEPVTMKLGDSLGQAVAIEGGVVVVGAEWEDSADVGVGGRGIDNSAPQSGAAYVFEFEQDAWLDRGNALAGINGDPLLQASGTLMAVSLNELSLSDAAPLASAALFVSLIDGAVPFKGGVLVAFPTVVPPIFLSTGSLGDVSLQFTWPGGVPSGTEVFFQFGIADTVAVQGVALSNAVQGTTP